MNSPHTGDQVAALLEALEHGAPDALERLTPLVYDELRLLASGYLRSERDDHTLETTGLVHEAYLKLVDQRSHNWQNRSHFFGIAAQAMRRILVDHARKRHATRREGGRPITLDEELAGAKDDHDILGVDEALQRLMVLDERQAKIVELRYFAGLTIEETAETMGVSPTTVKREWFSARAWLQRELS